MPRKLLFDIDTLDLSRREFSLEDIRETNLQRYEFEQLSAIVHFDPDNKRIVGLREISEDEFWVRGHVPGNALFPAVLMVEAAAQLCSFYCSRAFNTDSFYGFGGIDKARFRGIVTPGSTLYLVGEAQKASASRCSFLTQGVCEGKVVFEAGILGVRLPSPA